MTKTKAKEVTLVDSPKRTMEVIHRQSYGKDFFYPSCDYAKGLAKLLNQNTLTREQLVSVRASLDFEIVIKQPTITL